MSWFKRNKTKELILRAGCEVCGYLTVDANQKGMYFICPVCFWEDDSLDDDHQTDPNTPCNGPNHGLSLNQAKQNFKDFSACSKDMAHLVRKPLPEEIP